MISGEHCLVSVSSLWTVCGFPNPQQFQLNRTKEDDEEGWENPVGMIPMFHLQEL